MADKKPFTVLGVYNTGDAETIGERFADHVLADTPQEAEDLVSNARCSQSLLIAGVLAGWQTCLDREEEN